MRFLIVSLFVLLAAPGISETISDADVLVSIDQRADATAQLARGIWELAEVGYQETESSALLADALRQHGFTVEFGVADIPTAFVASYGRGGPVIGLLAEFDALPGINQDAVPERSPLPGKAAGHACGHNLFGAGSVGAAIAIRDWLEATGSPGEIRVYGTPAEEGGSGKVYLVRAGLFDDVDIAMHWHPDDENSANSQTSLANRSAKFRFHGRSAHAAGAPHKARSALDGVEAMNHMANLMREHIPQRSRMHYVITAGGEAPNVVPDFAEVFYYLRHPDAEVLVELWARLEATARGAAQGTETRLEMEIIHGNHSLVPIESLQKLAHQKLTEIGGITYTAKEQAFAEKLVASMDSPSNPLGSEATVQPYERRLGYGSTDVGDVSIRVPTLGIRTATYVPGTASHSWQAVAASGMSIGYKGAQLAAKTLALTAIELYQNPELRAEAKREHEALVGEAYVYRALLGDRAPPLDYRK